MMEGKGSAGAGRWVVCCVCLGLLLSLSPASFAGAIRSYSADQIFLDPQGHVRQNAKLYVEGEKFRMEGASPEGGGNFIVIIRRDRKLHYMLNPDKKTYFQRPLDEEALQYGMKTSFKKEGEEDLGTEKVSGYTCRKKRVTTTGTFMGRKHRSTSIVWVSKKFDIPLRVQDEDGSVSELRNIRKGKQPDKLFEVPPGYRRVSGIVELMGGLEDQEDRDGLKGAGQSGKTGDSVDIEEMKKNILKRLKKMSEQGEE